MNGTKGYGPVPCIRSRGLGLGRGVTVATQLAEVQAAVDRGNTALSRVEQIKRFTLLPEEWLPDSETMTPSMKLKRRQVTAKYQAQIDALYNG